MGMRPGLGAFVPPLIAQNGTRRAPRSMRCQNRDAQLPTSLTWQADTRASLQTDVLKAPRAPASIRNADVIIAGGGPIGSVAATLLHERGVNAVLVERESDFLTFNENASYALGLYPRAFRLLRTIPGLLEYLKPWQSSAQKFRFVNLDGTTSERDTREDMAIIEFFMRFRLTHLLKTFTCEQTDTLALYGREISDVTYLPSGEMDVSVRDDDPNGGSEVRTFRTRLILACDGRNSTILKTLRRKDDNSVNVRSKAGFALNERYSPAVGLKIRSLIVRNNIAFEKFGMDNGSFRGYLTSVAFEKKGRGRLRRFSIGIFPTVEADIQHMGGVLGVMVRVPDHMLWNMTSVEEGYAFFEENFPHLDIRKIVTADAMKAYVESRSRKFPTIARPESIAAYVGSEERADGGVIILGDAAHSFPPDTGQGVNSGFDDLMALTHVLDNAQQTASVTDIVSEFERMHDPDVWALMRIAQVTSPYQYGQVIWRMVLALVNIDWRSRFAKALPGRFYPSLTQMMQTSLPYREILRRADLTTRRLCFVALFGMMVLLCMFYALFV